MRSDPHDLDNGEREPLSRNLHELSPVRNQQRYRQEPSQPLSATHPQHNPPSTSQSRHKQRRDSSPARQELPSAHSERVRARAERSQIRDETRSEAPYPPAPPAHHHLPSSNEETAQQPLTTPGADDFGEAAAGGLAGVAYSIAERNPRESGLAAMTSPHYPQQIYQGHGDDYYAQQQHQQQQYPHQPPHPQDDPYGSRGRGYEPPMFDQYAARPPLHPAPYGGSYEADRASHSSSQGLSAGAVPMGADPPGYDPRSRSPYRAQPAGTYSDDPYQSYTSHPHPQLGMVNPNDIDDDGDEGLEYGQRRHRTSMLSFGNTSARDGKPVAGAAVAVDGSGQYSSVRNGAGTRYDGAGGDSYDLGATGAEKSEWLSKHSKSSKKWKWLIGIALLLLIGAGIGVGVYFGIIKKSATKSQTASEDTAANGDLSITSSEIQALMNNKNLHKIFPGIDYTPINTQFPDCLSNPPSQNNVTRDVAVLSQLTNTLRLYGTDCNQTEMTIHALKQLKLDTTVKIWLGVWQDGNTTTNARQLAQMWKILDTYGADPFKGVIVANEILFREQMTITELGTLLSSVRQNITSKGMSLPVATSDLGDNWTAELAAQSDYIMSNIHPFFGGVNANDAAAWTYSFWENHNEGFFKSDLSHNVIAETGWPSQGGSDCGSTSVTVCPNGSVAGIDQMNQFMSDWVCQALANGTEYFWFESFDEPWKIMYNTASQNWEDHWGLMDVNRNLKTGIKIPDCGGKTVS